MAADKRRHIFAKWDKMSLCLTLRGGKNFLKWLDGGKRYRVDISRIGDRGMNTSAVKYATIIVKSY